MFTKSSISNILAAFRRRDNSLSTTCCKGESVIYIAWTTIWHSCITKIKGFKYPNDDTTSTKAWSKRTAIGSTFLQSYNKSGVKGVLLKWSNNNPWVLFIIWTCNGRQS